MALSAGCSSDASAPMVSNQRIEYADELHNENTEMIRLDDRILLAFRGGERGQIGSDRAVILVFESTDDGQTFEYISEVTMPPEGSDEPGAGRDIRDPKFVKMGDKLFMYSIARLPGFTYRDLFKDSWTVRAESVDGGRTWTKPVQTYVPEGPLRWGFWRFTKRQYEEGGESRETLYATAYSDGDDHVAFFASEDGVDWQFVSYIIENNWPDAPSEAELNFFGDNDEIAVSVVRLDNQGNLEDGESAICTSLAPFADWECGRRVEQRLGGPTWIVRRDGNEIRNFIFARKHLECTFKRTAVYEIVGDLTDPDAPVQMCEIQELRSSGDTAYTALVPITDDRWLLSWYSTPPERELAWLEGQFEPSDIWLADVHFSRAPRECVTPVKAGPCPPAELPAGTEVFDASGPYLMTVSPVIWPANELSFRADLAVHDTTVDLTLQPLDIDNEEPVGDPMDEDELSRVPWVLTDLPIEDDGSFVADFGKRNLPWRAYPIVDVDTPFPLESFVVTAKTVSDDVFCGGVTGHAQFLTQYPADRINLDGSTFGAVRIEGETLPEAQSACP